MRRPLAALVAGGLLAALAMPVAAQQTCTVFDSSTEEVLPGVTLTWTSSFLCEDAEPEGEYTITVTVSNDAGSSEAVTIDDLALSHTTPRPGGSGPDATAEATGLPITVAPGGSDTFDVTGSYELVSTDEGDKANVHLTAFGVGVSSGLAFELGINVHLRGAGAEEDGGNAGGAAGPPSWVTAFHN